MRKFFTIMTPPPTPSILPTIPAIPPTGIPRSDCETDIGSICPQKARFRIFRPLELFNPMHDLEMRPSREYDDATAASSSITTKIALIPAV